MTLHHPIPSTTRPPSCSTLNNMTPISQYLLNHTSRLQQYNTLHHPIHHFSSEDSALLGFPHFDSESTLWRNFRNMARSRFGDLLSIFLDADVPHTDKKVSNPNLQLFGRSWQNKLWQCWGSGIMGSGSLEVLGVHGAENRCYRPKKFFRQGAVFQYRECVMTFSGFFIPDI